MWLLLIYASYTTICCAKLLVTIAFHNHKDVYGRKIVRRLLAQRSVGIFFTFTYSSSVFNLIITAESSILEIAIIQSLHQADKTKANKQTTNICDLVTELNAS